MTNSNKLIQGNIDTILAAYTAFTDQPYFSKRVRNADIAQQGYNLSVSTYVEQEDTREEVDIGELNAVIERIVAREQVLRDEITKIISEIEVDDNASV